MHYVFAHFLRTLKLLQEAARKRLLLQLMLIPTEIFMRVDTSNVLRLVRSQNDLYGNNMQSVYVTQTINNPCTGISKTKLEALFKFVTSYSSNNRGGTRLRIVTGSVGEKANRIKT